MPVIPLVLHVTASEFEALSELRGRFQDNGPKAKRLFNEGVDELLGAGTTAALKDGHIRIVVRRDVPAIPSTRGSRIEPELWS